VSDQIEEKILSLYALRNCYSQISEYIEEFYGVEFSKATISSVTDKIIPLLKEWQQRPLESVYPFIWLDGKKEILGLCCVYNGLFEVWLEIGWKIFKESGVNPLNKGFKRCNSNDLHHSAHASHSAHIRHRWSSAFRFWDLAYSRFCC